MKCVVVDMRNRLFGDAISGSLQHFDAGFRVYQTEGTAAEDLCADTHADVLVAEVTAYPPWRLEQRLDLCRRLRQGLPGCRVVLPMPISPMPSACTPSDSFSPGFGLGLNPRCRSDW